MVRTRFTSRPGFKIGPFRFSLNIGRTGVTSANVRAAGVTYNVPVDRNGRRTRSRGVSSVNLPGPWSIRPDRRASRPTDSTFPPT